MRQAVRSKREREPHNDDKGEDVWRFYPLLFMCGSLPCCDWLKHTQEEPTSAAFLKTKTLAGVVVTFPSIRRIVLYRFSSSYSSDFAGL